MKEEILAAVMFFVRFIEKSEKFPRDQLENFKKYLTELLMERFEKHWFPDLPSKGQGYRCIRVNGVSPVDLTLEQAARKCGLTYVDLSLPTELTVWVDPSEVCYRLGESEGSYCTLATFPSDSSSESSTPTNSPPSTPLQEKFRRIQKQYHNHHHPHHSATIQNYQRYPLEVSNIKYRNHPNMALSASIRTKSTLPREMNCNYNPNRHHQMYNTNTTNKFDGVPFPMNPAFYRNLMNYNRPHYKNVLRV